MPGRVIYLTENDLRRLRSLLSSMLRSGGENESRWKEFSAALENAVVVKSELVPPNVVTMNSVVRLLDLETQEETLATLVFPHMADIDDNRVSILSPQGTALIGCRKGESLPWPVLDNFHRMRIEEIIYQPEADGLISMDYTA
jgi:regulator of nucleoside diphosphate kinase